MSDLFTAIPAQPQRVATLTDYLVDLFVKGLTDAQLGQRKQAGDYQNIRKQDLTGYHAMARGSRT